MPFTQGHEKSGGRQKGTGNKDTEPIRIAFRKLIEDSLEQLKSDLASLDPVQRLKIIEGLSEFCIPKIQRTELTGKDGEEIPPVIVRIHGEDIEL